MLKYWWLVHLKPSFKDLDFRRIGKVETRDSLTMWRKSIVLNIVIKNRIDSIKKNKGDFLKKVLVI